MPSKMIAETEAKKIRARGKKANVFYDERINTWMIESE